MNLTHKALIDANHEACAAYDKVAGDGAADPQAMGEALRGGCAG